MRKTFHAKIRLTAICFVTFLPLSVQGYTEPTLAPPKTFFSSLSPHAAFTQKLSAEEQATPWGQECFIGIQFAKKGDFYQAITSFQRSLILLPNPQRQPSIEYMIVLAYYLGGRFEEALEFFIQSAISLKQEQHPHQKDVLIILYDCYLRTQNAPRAMQLLHTPLFSQKEQASLALYGHLYESNWDCLYQSAKNSSPAKEFVCTYQNHAKNEHKAKWLNVILPGAGYFYLGQTQTACIAFSINALFIVAAYQFFQHHLWAAGLITCSLEVGWYLGGIYGALEQASLHNAKIYENLANSLLYQERLFPALQLQRSF